MKRLLEILAVCLALSAPAGAQPIIRSPFTTNSAPQTNTSIFGNYSFQGGATSLARARNGIFTNALIEALAIPSLDDPLGTVSLTYAATSAREFSLRTTQPTNVIAFLGFANVTYDSPVLSFAASASNSPAGNEFPTAGWVRGLLAGQGLELYNTTNISTVATNLANPQPVYTFSTVVPPPMSVTFNGVTNNEYLGSTVTTNRFQSISGPIVGNSWIFFPSGAGRALSLHEEIYFSYDGTNWFGDYETGNQTITAGSTNLYSFLVAFPTYTSTNATGFFIQKRRKVGVQSANPNVTIWVGTNTPSHIDLAGPNSLAGNAFLADNQTFTGANTFTGTVRAKTVQKAPVYSNSTVNATSIIASFGLDETIVEVQTNAVSLASSQGRSSNVVCFANFTLFNYCGSNATVTFNTSWMPLGLCTNTLTLTNAKSMRVSVGFAGRAVAGWDSETNVFYGYSFQP